MTTWVSVYLTKPSFTGSFLPLLVCIIYYYTIFVHTEIYSRNCQFFARNNTPCDEERIVKYNEQRWFYCGEVALSSFPEEMLVSLGKASPFFCSWSWVQSTSFMRTLSREVVSWS